MPIEKSQSSDKDGSNSIPASPQRGAAAPVGSSGRCTTAAPSLTSGRWGSAISGPGQVIWPRVVTIVGLSICFAPANVAAYLYTPKELRGAAVGLLSLLRNEGGSVGTSLSQVLQERRDQFHSLRLNENLDPFNPSVQSFIEQSQAFLLQQTGDPALSQELAWQALENLRQQQASSLAYFDCFWVFAMLMLALVPVVLLMKRSVAEKGA